MIQSKTKIWIHGIIETREQLPFLKPKIEKIVFGYLRNELSELGCTLADVAGTENHVHILFLQNPNKSLGDIFRQIKTASAHSINLASLIPEEFSWDIAFAAFSLGESQLDKTKEYFANQKEAHKKTTLPEELERFFKLYNIPNEQKPD